MEELVFNEDKHEYLIGNVKLPSVTQILKLAGVSDWSKIDKHTLSLAAARGTRVHNATEKFDLGQLDWRDVRDEDEGYVLAYEKFVTETGFQYGLIEEPVHHPTHRYAGKLDRTGIMWKVHQDDPIIIDIKTGSVPKSTAIQLSAYAHCLDRGPAYRRYAVNLKDDGTYRLVEFKEQTDWHVFLAALKIARWKLRK